jgi:uncharacterized protein YjbI with pentapeptide repeats
MQRSVSGANLFKANLTGADQTGVSFGLANLRGANLTDAILTSTKLIMGDLKGAIFAGARCRHVVTVDVDLSQAQELESVRHEAPSSLNVDTLVHSMGTIPEAFLRGWGMVKSCV